MSDAGRRCPFLSWVMASFASYLVVISLIPSTAQAAGSDQMCRRLQAMMQFGAGTLAADPLLPALSRHSGGRLVLAPWRRDKTYDAVGFREVARLPGLMSALNTYNGGTAQCSDVTPVLETRGRRLPLVAPWVATGACRRWGMTLSLGKLDGRPFLAQEHSNEIALSAWTGAAWGPACSVVARVAPAFQVEQAICTSANCTAALRAAKKVAGRSVQGAPGERRWRGEEDESYRLLDELQHTVVFDPLPLGAERSGVSPSIQTIAINGSKVLALIDDWRGGPA